MKLKVKRTLLLIFILISLIVITYAFINHFNEKSREKLAKEQQQRKNQAAEISLIKEKLIDQSEDENFSFNDNKRNKNLINNEKLSASLKSNNNNNNDLENIRKLNEINCLINDDYNIKCLHYRNEVFIPFRFIHEYFDINGKLINTKASDSDSNNYYFNWQHSYSKVIHPKTKYNSLNAYLWFDNYNVEIRDRVKCISGLHNVPISLQWNSHGHYYPIQISQYGLSHYSKNLTSGKPRITVLENGDYRSTNWQLEVNGNDYQVKSIEDDDEENYLTSNKVLLINGKKIVFKIKISTSSKKQLNNNSLNGNNNKNNDLVFNIRYKQLNKANFIISILLENDDGLLYQVTYKTCNETTFNNEENIIYGIGEQTLNEQHKWRQLVRDVGVDLLKAYQAMNRKLNSKTVKTLRISKIIFTGNALVDDVQIQSSAHEYNFYSAVKWLLANQDMKGGWPIHATRKLSHGLLLLKPGWYSAMAQGQAISLLIRAYHVTKNNEYINAAMNAINLFEVNASDGGVRTFFLNEQQVWYEEYPTTPSTFVLNGFIYSLFGLYDLKSVCKRDCLKVNELLNAGLDSLRKLLPLYDSGSGSLYDLRHINLRVPPNLARWDYHTTHINQLLYLNTIYKEKLFETVSKRWITYMKGKRAPHN